MVQTKQISKLQEKIISMQSKLDALHDLVKTQTQQFEAILPPKDGGNEEKGDLKVKQEHTKQFVNLPQTSKRRSIL
jgi:hypothetical protein